MSFIVSNQMKFSGSAKENIAPNYYSQSTYKDKQCLENASEFSSSLKADDSDYFLGLKSGERTSNKRSSVLCEKQEDNSSFVLKQVFSNALDNIIQTSNTKTPDQKSIIKQKSFKDEAYLFSTQSKLKTPNKGKVALKHLVDDVAGNSLDLAEQTSYGGMGTTRASNRITVVCPFSFQARNDEMLKKKQEKLSKVQEENKKSRDFHARPVPSYILSSNQNKMNTSTPKQNKIKKDITKESNCEERIFKAKFPDVLYKQPFVPVKSEKLPLTPKKICLNTERRATERKTKKEFSIC